MRLLRTIRSSQLAEWRSGQRNGLVAQRPVDRNHAPLWPFGVLGFLAEQLRGWPFEDHDLQRPRRLVVGASRRGRDSPGSTPGVDIILDNLLEWSKGVDSSSTSAGSNPTIVMLLLRSGHGEIRPAPLAQTTPACLERVWPSGLRCWLQAPVREGVGSNPTRVIRVGFALVFPPSATFFRCLFPARVSHDCLAESARKGMGSNPAEVARLASILLSARSSRQAKSMTPAGTRTCNPRLLRPMPHPSGHGACCSRPTSFGRAACCVRG